MTSKEGPQKNGAESAHQKREQDPNNLKHVVFLTDRCTTICFDKSIVRSMSRLPPTNAQFHVLLGCSLCCGFGYRCVHTSLTDSVDPDGLVIA